MANLPRKSPITWLILLAGLVLSLVAWTSTADKPDAWGKFTQLDAAEVAQLSTLFSIDASDIFLHEDWQTAKGFGPAAFVSTRPTSDIITWERLNAVYQVTGIDTSNDDFLTVLDLALTYAGATRLGELGIDPASRTMAWQDTSEIEGENYAVYHSRIWNTDDTRVTQIVVLAAESDMLATQGDLFSLVETLVGLALHE